MKDMSLVEGMMSETDLNNLQEFYKKFDIFSEAVSVSLSSTSSEEDEELWTAEDIDNLAKISNFCGEYIYGARNFADILLDE